MEYCFFKKNKTKIYSLISNFIFSMFYLLIVLKSSLFFILLSVISI